MEMYSKTPILQGPICFCDFLRLASLIVPSVDRKSILIHVLIVTLGVLTQCTKDKFKISHQHQKHVFAGIVGICNDNNFSSRRYCMKTTSQVIFDPFIHLKFKYRSYAPNQTALACCHQYMEIRLLAEKPSPERCLFASGEHLLKRLINTHIECSLYSFFPLVLFPDCLRM